MWWNSLMETFWLADSEVQMWLDYVQCGSSVIVFKSAYWITTYGTLRWNISGKMIIFFRSLNLFYLMFNRHQQKHTVQTVAVNVVWAVSDLAFHFVLHDSADWYNDGWNNLSYTLKIVSISAKNGHFYPILYRWQ